MRRISNDREATALFRENDGVDVKRVASAGFKSADASLAKNHAFVARLRDVVAGQDPLFHESGKPALDEDRPLAVSKFLEKRVIVHVARADLKHVDDLLEIGNLPGIRHFGDKRQAGFSLHHLHDLVGILTQALKAFGIGPEFEDPAAQADAALGAHQFGRFGKLLL